MTLEPLWSNPAPEGSSTGLDLLGASLEDLTVLVAHLGEKPFRARQIFEGLHRSRWQTWGAFTVLPPALRQRLDALAPLVWPDITASFPSEDLATKHAFRLGDGRVVEGVHMPYEDRTTLCLSSQIGCAMGCTFCATATLGIVRNLTAGEIVAQVYAMLHAHDHPPGRPVNLVFMGMGEPLHNLDHVMGAFRILTHPKGLAIPPRRITVSTSGLVPGIRRLAGFTPRPRLALSLNATTDAQRSAIMPVNRAWGLDALGEALAAFPLESGERITLEYVLLRDHTDSMEDGQRLAAFAARFPSKVNLIPFNEHEGAGFQPPSEARVSQLCQLLARRGIPVMVRRSRGQDVAGACGQLARRAPLPNPNTSESP